MKKGLKNGLSLLVVMVIFALLMPVGVWAEEVETASQQVKTEISDETQTIISEPDQETMDFSGVTTIEATADTSLDDTSASITVAGTGDNYPEPWRSGGGTPYYVNSIFQFNYDSWGYAVQNCTSWVAWALHDRNGFEMPRAIGNASAWGTWAKNNGYAVDGNPQIGSVAWWPSNHVAWVKSVNNDGTVTIEEYNYNWSGTYHCRNIAKGSVQYIHFKDINLPPSDTTPPSISNVQITDVNAEGFTVRCNVSDNVGVTSVNYATWTDANGQDDLKWADGGLSGNDSSYRVLYRDHNNERGSYRIDIRAYDAAGNGIEPSAAGITIDSTPPVISTVEVIAVDSSGYTVKLKATDESGLARVQFPTWTTANGQDDLVNDWANNAAVSGTIEGDTVTFRVRDSAHNFEKGEYITHIHAYDKFGNESGYEVNAVNLENSGVPIVQETLGNTTYLLFDDAMTWPEAKIKAEELGGNLVTITSQDEQSLIEEMMQSGQRDAYFIGGTDEGHEGTFTWITGEVFGLAKWAGGEPNNAAGSENYLEVYRSGFWNDIPGNIKRGFIVEIDSSAFRVNAFIADKASGQPVNTAINLIVAGSGGASPYQYKFYYKLGSITTTIQNFTASNTAVFKPTIQGNYTLYVEVRDTQGHSVTKSMVMQINEGGGSSESQLISYLGKDPGGNYYRYSAMEFNKSFFAYRINPSLTAAKMYQQYLNSQCRIVALEERTKGYMDYNAMANACLKARLRGQTFDINAYFASSAAKLFAETVENVRIVNADGNF